MMDFESFKGVTRCRITVALEEIEIKENFATYTLKMYIHKDKTNGY